MSPALAKASGRLFGLEDLDDDEEEEDGMHGTWDEDERLTELELEQDSRVSFIALRSPTLEG